MAKIDDITIRKIKESNDIVDVIGEYLELTPKGKNYFAAFVKFLLFKYSLAKAPLEELILFL